MHAHNEIVLSPSDQLPTHRPNLPTASTINTNTTTSNKLTQYLTQNQPT